MGALYCTWRDFLPLSPTGARHCGGRALGKSDRNILCCGWHSAGHWDTKEDKILFLPTLQKLLVLAGETIQDT